MVLHSPSVTLPLCVSPPLWTSDEREVPYLPTPLPPFTPISASIQGGLLCTAVSLLTPVEYTAGDELPVQTRALRMRLQICNTITAQQMKRALMERMTNITISVARGRPALCGFASLMCARRGRWFGESGKRKWQGLKFYYQCLLCKRWHRAYAFFPPADSLSLAPRVFSVVWMRKQSHSVSQSVELQSISTLAFHSSLILTMEEDLFLNIIDCCKKH